MKNPLIKCLQDLFEDVHNGHIGRRVALERFCFKFSGLNYIPQKPMTTKEMARRMLNNGGFDVKDIARRLKTSTAYVYKIRKEL